MKKFSLAMIGFMALSTVPALANWNFSSGPTPNAFLQSNNMSLELQCDRIRFAPAGYQDSQDIINKQGISIRFMKNGSTADQDVTYGLFDLKGSSAAIKSLRSSCGHAGHGGSASMEAPEGVVYCGGGQVKRQIEYRILDKPDGKWDAVVSVNGKEIRAMTAYSYFGNAEPPEGFVVALLGEDRSEFLVFQDGNKRWLEYGDYTYRQCN